MNLEKEMFDKHYHCGDSLVMIIELKEAVKIAKRHTTEMCKRQREICKKIIAKMDVSKLYLTPQEMIIIENEILNSPLATEE